MRLVGFVWVGWWVLFGFLIVGIGLFWGEGICFWGDLRHVLTRLSTGGLLNITCLCVKLN